MKYTRCYEYLACKKRDCVMFSQPEDDYTLCWKVEGTLCQNEYLEDAVKDGLKKMDFCIHCIYRTFMTGEIPSLISKSATI